METNRRLRAERARLGLTQRDVAEKVGLREINISRIETGRARPNPETKRRIAEVLHKPTYELFDC